MLASKQVFGMAELGNPGVQRVVEAERQSRTEEAELSPARLRIAVGRLSRRLRPTAAAGSLTATEVDVLVAAEREGPVRMSDLAGFAGLNPTMLSRLMPKLEEAGLIRRFADAADKRVSRVQATTKGRRLLERVRSERNDALSRRLAELTPEQRRALVAALPVLEALAERLLGPPAALPGTPAPSAGDAGESSVADAGAVR
jgi:DNA-binding MarR family transcriptional regulator